MRMRSLTYLSLLLATSLPVAANVKGDIHDKCLTAVDYAGCVKVNSEISEVNGNACEPGFAYFGDNTCREVVCTGTVRHSPILGGKMWKCNKAGIVLMLLQPGIPGDMIIDTSCPEGKPEIGWNSTCNSPYEEPPKKNRFAGRQA